MISQEGQKPSRFQRMKKEGRKKEDNSRGCPFYKGEEGRRAHYGVTACAHVTYVGCPIVPQYELFTGLKCVE